MGVDSTGHLIKLGIGAAWRETSLRCPKCNASAVERNVVTDPYMYRCTACGLTYTEQPAEEELVK
jgi:uncharacterized Zn finger protein